MFAAIKQMTAVGAAVAGLGWVTFVSPAVAYTQAPRIPLGNGITCPANDGTEAQYVADPDDANAYYVCAGGVPQQHLRCPAVARLNMSTTPPTCLPSSNHHMP